MNTFSLAFSVSNLGPKTFQKILSHFENLEKAWNGDKTQFAELGVGNKSFESFDTFRKEFDLKKYSERLKSEKTTFISFLDSAYPKSFKKLENPPIGIFCKGNSKLLKHDFLFSVVGTRKVTSYSKSVTESIVSDLSKNGACIVSGLALGIDGISHRVALEDDAPTIAVLACGVDCCLPSENFSLYKSILDNNGLIISEYPLSMPPNKGTFLARNRLVAALSQGVLVTEAAEDSGSLVTAEWGFRLSKKVFAVPGPITSRMSDGSLKLLKQGARLTTNANDILQEFSISRSQSSIKSKLKKLNLSKEEIKIVNLLEDEGMTIDEIAKKTKFPISKLFVLVSGLELRKIINNSSGKFRVSR